MKEFTLLGGSIFDHAVENSASFPASGPGFPVCALREGVTPQTGASLRTADFALANRRLERPRGISVPFGCIPFFTRILAKGTKSCLTCRVLREGGGATLWGLWPQEETGRGC